MNNQQVNAFSNLKINELPQPANDCHKRPSNGDGNYDNLISNASIGASLNSSFNVVSNQPASFPWNYDSGIHTKMPGSQANSCTGRDDEMDTICSLSQNSNLIDETAIAGSVSNIGPVDDQATYGQELIAGSVNSNINNNVNGKPNYPINQNAPSNRKLRAGPNLTFSQQNNFQNHLAPQSPMPSTGYHSLNNQPIHNPNSNHLISDHQLTTHNSPANLQQPNIAARPLSTSSQVSFQQPDQTGHLSQPKAEPGSSSSARNAQTITERVREDVAGLIDLLNDHDDVVVLQAVRIVYCLFQDENHRKIVMTSNDLVKSIVRLANVFNHLEILNYAVVIFYNFSLFRDGLQMIYQNDVVPTLCKLLRETRDNNIVDYSTAVLHNLIMKQDGAKIAVRKANGLPIIVRLLARNDCKFLSVVTDCLHLITYQNQENKQLMLECGGPQELIRILNTYDYPKLVFRVIRILKVLSVCPKNKQAIVHFGGMHALTKTLNLRQDTRVANNSLTNKIVLNSLWTLRNLSDAATNLNSLQGLLQSLVSLLQDEDSNKALCSTQILANLTCNNQFNKQFVVGENGLNRLMETLFKIRDRREEIVEPTLLALRHLTTRHADAEFCCNAIRLSRGLQPIVQFLQPPSTWPVIKACINLIRNLAICPANSQPLREMNVIQRLYQLLFKADQEIKRTCTTFSFENIISCSAEDVKMYEIIDGALGSLLVLAQDPANCAIIIDLGFISLCIGIIYNYQLESILKLAVGCLNELTKLPLG